MKGGDEMISIYRRVETDAARWFSAEEVAKAKDYQRPLGRMRTVGAAVNLVVLLVFITGQVAPRLADALGANAWPLRFVVTLGALILLFTVVSLPFAIWQTFGHDRRWGFSTETPATFVGDLVKSVVLNLVLLTALLLPVWWLVRTTDLWWVYGWLVFFGFSVGLGLLFPVLIMPLFNKFTPLEEPELADRLRAMAAAVGLKVSEVLVMDASKRTTKDNAMMTGLGRTRRVIVFDNMLAYPHRMIEIVVAHELSHWRRRHIVRMALVGSVITFLLFAAIRVVTGWQAALDWAGVSDVGDPAVLPLVALVFTAGSATVTVLRNWLSRAYERQADLDALQTTREPEMFIDMMRRFATKNLADLAPSRWDYLLKHSHPPMPERMELAAAWQRETSPAS